MTHIDYYYEMQPLGNLELKDIGNCYIKANTDLNEQFYFATKTIRGTTKILVFGPIDPNNQELQANVSYKNIRLEYNPSKIKKQLDIMLNSNPKFKLTQAIEITKEELIKSFKSPIEIFLEDSNEDSSNINIEDFEEGLF